MYLQGEVCQGVSRSYYHAGGRELNHLPEPLRLLFDIFTNARLYWGRGRVLYASNICLMTGLVPGCHLRDLSCGDPLRKTKPNRAPSGHRDKVLSGCFSRLIRRCNAHSSISEAVNCAELPDEPPLLHFGGSPAPFCG